MVSRHLYHRSLEEDSMSTVPSQQNTRDAPDSKDTGVRQSVSSCNDALVEYPANGHHLGAFQLPDDSFNDVNFDEVSSMRK